MKMFSRLLKKYNVWCFAVKQRNKMFKSGTLLNAFYKSKTIFIHIPKTAGISLIKAIYGDVTHEGHRSFYFNSLVLGTKNDKYFSFAFIRNPYDRLYSAYSFLKKGGLNNYDKIAYKTHLSQYKNFEDFVLNGLNTKIISQVTHLIPQSDFICNYRGRILVDFVGKFESFDDDVNNLSLKIGKEIKVKHLNRNNKQHYTDVYNKKMIDKVAIIYKRDLEIFNYSFR